MRESFIFFLLSAIAFKSLAQCCSGGVPMAGNLGMPDAEKNVLQLSLSYDWNNLNTLKTASENLSDRSRRRETHAILIEAGYTFTEKISLDIFLSWIRQERTIRTIGNNFDATQGIGDASILAKYKLNEKLTLGYGLKLPLGSFDEENNQGIVLNADLQPGSGAWDQIIYARYNTQIPSTPSLSLGWIGIHRFRGSNDSYLGNSQYKFGNETQLIVSASNLMAIKGFVLEPSLKVQLRKTSRDQFNNADFPGSGGLFVFINPGISMNFSQTFNYFINTSLPIYSEVYDAQLAPTVRINTGFYYKINIKRN